MKPITQEWVNKSEGDFATAQRELQVQQMPNYDAVCSHAQQCIEKYLKACLQEENIAFTKTHDLSALLDLFLPVQPGWASLRPTLDALTTYAVEFQHPGGSANQAIAAQAFQDCAAIRQAIRQHLYKLTPTSCLNHDLLHPQPYYPRTALCSLGRTQRPSRSG